jgi:ligand-binding sensor domain-containing protein
VARLFDPTKAFTVQGEVLWCATDAEVGIINMRGKKSDVQRFKTLGAMPAEGIVAIAIDKQGGVWFGGPNGVAQKSGTQFTVYTSEKGLSDNMVTSIAVANDGAVWVGTENGLNVYNNGSWKKYSTKEGLVSNKIQTLLADKKGTVWVGTNKGISIWNGAKWSSQTAKNGMSWNDTKALAYDNKTGLLWASVGEKDVNSFDGQKWNVYMDILQGITSIMADSHSRIWFGSGNGLVKFNDEEWISDPSKLGVPGAQIFQIYCDEGGNHWFANENGVVRMANPYPY